MVQLEPPDTHYFSAAVGWLELGNPAEARAELGQMSAAGRKQPDVCEVHWQVCAELKLWEEGLEVARALLASDPQRASGWLHQAYALRRVPGGSIEKAWEALLPAFDKFPTEPIIPYNLACYACQMKQLQLAREWLQRAALVGTQAQIKKMALEDPDLEPLWEEIRRL